MTQQAHEILPTPTSRPRVPVWAMNLGIVAVIAWQGVGYLLCGLVVLRLAARPGTFATVGVATVEAATVADTGGAGDVRVVPGA